MVSSRQPALASQVCVPSSHSSVSRRVAEERQVALLPEPSVTVNWRVRRVPVSNGARMSRVSTAKSASVKSKCAPPPPFSTPHYFMARCPAPVRIMLTVVGPRSVPLSVSVG